jgi:hypothetical protein
LLEEALKAAGLEVTRGSARVPAREQLLAVLANGPLDEKDTATRLVGVAPAERKELVEMLLAESAIRRVARPSGVALVNASKATLDSTNAAQVAGELERALRWIRRATRPSRGGPSALLAADVTALVARLSIGASGIATSAPVSSAGPPAASALLDRVASTARELATHHGGLAPVPQLVRAIGAPTASVHAALLEGYARGWFELQPESSMGRFGAEDIALCLPGPAGTRLSWVRPLRSDASPATKGATT